jgi:hypothetical protein
LQNLDRKTVAEVVNSWRSLTTVKHSSLAANLMPNSPECLSGKGLVLPGF